MGQTLTKRGRKTRDKILAAARELFHQQGVTATSVDQILSLSETGKSQFYYYFPSKEDLIRDVITGFFDELLIEEGVDQHNLDTWEDLESWWRAMVRLQEEYECIRGCLLANIGFDLTQDQRTITEEVQKCMRLQVDRIEEMFRRMQAQGKISTEADPADMAKFCFTAYQGGTLMSRIHQDIDYMHDSARHTLDYLKTFKTDES